jgi:hypothetical protein
MLVNKIIPIVCLMALLSSCSTDFELEAEWKDIPVVYSFISPQDTAHYVRVQKAFLEPGGNAFEIATNPDSIYYGADDITVTLENTETGESFVMARVNGNDEGYPKEEGTFATDPNVLYKLPYSALSLEPGDPIRLVINRGDDKEPAIATTTVAGIVDSVSTSPPPKTTRWLYTQVKRFGWKTDPENKIFDIRLILNYQEFPVGNPSAIEDKSLEWVINDAVINDRNENSLSVEVFGSSFYNFVGQNIPEDPNVIRLFRDFDMYVTGAGQELFDFVRLQQANVGITSAQNIPTYSNVENGLGVFTSRYQMFRPRLRITDEARDSLISGIYTKHLNFR